MEAGPKLDVLAGASTLSFAGVAHLISEISPFISFIAVLTGAILGCHGVYHLIKNRWHGKNTPPTDIHFY